MVVDAAELQGHVWAMAKTPDGTWAVQNALDQLPEDAHRLMLVEEMKGHTRQALRSPHANHVLQKCIAVVRAGAAQFIVDELMEPGEIVRTAKHRYGCRVMQRLLEHLSAPQLVGIVHQLAADSAKLSTHMYGNYVIRSLMEHCPGEAHHEISLAIIENAGTMMHSRYGRAVVADALDLGDQEDQLSIAHALLVDGVWLRRVETAGSRYLPVIARRMMNLLPMEHVQHMCESLMEAEPRLRQHDIGRKLLRLGRLKLRA
jgi:hypothetical protein